MKTILVNIYGRVQGVGFRYFAMKTALAFRIAGYVKNEADGSVTLKAMGEEEELNKFLEVLEEGNGFSHVDCMSIEDIQSEKFNEFKVVY